MVDVNPSNFKALRKKNKIKVEAISDACKLNVNTIRHFENSYKRGYTDGILARDYNADLMIRTLQKLIDEKEEAEMKNESKSKQLKTKVRIRLVDLAEVIRAYTEANNMTMEEFAKMCNISKNVFAAYYIKKIEHVSQPTINKICQATGWTIDQIMSGDILNNAINKEDDMSYVGTPKSIEAFKQAESEEKEKLSVVKVDTDSIIKVDAFAKALTECEVKPDNKKPNNNKSVVIEFAEFEKFERALVNLQKDRLDSMHGYMAYPVRKENIGYYNAMTDVLELVSELRTKAKLQ